MKLLIGILLLLFISCQKQVNINQNPENPNLPVFSGWISNLEGEQAIQIQSTGNFSSTNSPIYMSGGIVSVSNNGSLEYFTETGDNYLSNLNYALSNGICSIDITINNKTYTQQVEVFDPIEINSISYDEDISGEGIVTGIYADFTLPSEENYTIVFELLVDSTGNGDSFKSLTPTIHDMELFNNHVDEYNVYGDIYLFSHLLTSDDGTIRYKLISHRISTLQYNYLLRIQEEPSGSIYSTQPVNLPSMFSNDGLGIVIVSSDSFVEFSF